MPTHALVPRHDQVSSPCAHRTRSKGSLEFEGGIQRTLTVRRRLVGGPVTQRFASRAATSCSHLGTGLDKQARSGTARWPWVGDPAGASPAFERAQPSGRHEHAPP